MSFLKSAAGSAFGGKMTNLRGSSSVDSISSVYSIVKPNAAPERSEVSKLISNSCPQVSGRFFSEPFVISDCRRCKPHTNTFLHNYALLFCHKGLIAGIV